MAERSRKKSAPSSAEGKTDNDAAVAASLAVVVPARPEPVEETASEPETAQGEPAGDALQRLQQSIQERQRRGQERARQQWQKGKGRGFPA